MSMPRIIKPNPTLMRQLDKILEQNMLILQMNNFLVQAMSMPRIFVGPNDLDSNLVDQMVNFQKANKL